MRTSSVLLLRASIIPPSLPRTVTEKFGTNSPGCEEVVRELTIKVRGRFSDRKVYVIPDRLSSVSGSVNSERLPFAPKTVILALGWDPLFHMSFAAFPESCSNTPLISNLLPSVMPVLPLISVMRIVSLVNAVGKRDAHGQIVSAGYFFHQRNHEILGSGS